MKFANNKGVIELFALSVVALFFELLVIRWMSGDFRGVAVFRTFPLVTCFVGLGLGFALGNDRMYKRLPLALLFFVITMRLAEFFKLGFFGFPSQAIFTWQGVPVAGEIGITYFVMFSVTLIVLLMGPFWASVCIGSRLGVVFNELPPLNAYAVNLLGSILGSAMFTVLSFLEAPPWMLLLATGLMVVPFAASQRRIAWLVTGCVVGAIAFAPCSVNALQLSEDFEKYQDGGVTTMWSPYQRLDLRTYADKGPNNEKRFLGLELGVNRLFYQYFIPPQIPLDSFPEVFKDLVINRRDQYSLPERIKPGESVLVLAAGSGQDVAAAIDNGAKEVDAVDIDPVILNQGRRFNPVYSQPNVHLFCDDARHYIDLCTKRYDLIVFSFLDSHAVLGQGSSVRLDSYPYTCEGIKNAMKLMKPDGIMVVSFSAVTDWLERRIYTTIRQAAGYDPLIISGKEGLGHVFFVLGEDVKNNRVAIPSGWTRKKPPVVEASERLLTDDWPYLYVRHDVVDVPYLLIVGEILLLSIIASSRVFLGGASPLMWQMFFLGAAFILLELHAISFLSLMFGSTWLTSAIVINAILAMLLCANLMVMRFGPKIANRDWIIFVLLFGSIVLNYVVPLNELGRARDFVSCAGVTILTLLPLFFAGCLFPKLFQRAENPSRAFAFNLFGSVVGGILEYLSNYFGIKSLLLVALALYFCVFLCNRLGDKKAAPDQS